MMGLIQRNSKYVFAASSVILFASFATQLGFHAVRASATVDEPFHILAGHRHLQCGDYGINPEHPPLAKMLAAAPLAFRELTEPPWDCGSKLTSKFDGFSYGASFVADNGVDSVVIPTRLAASLMSLLLAVMVFLAAWEMFGRWEALAALAIIAFEPNLIAHGSLVTTDMAISATAFAAVYALYRYGSERTVGRFLFLACSIGLMLAAKHSAVIFIGILLVLLVGDISLFRSHTKRSLLQNGAAFASAFLIGVAILWAFYGFRYYAIPAASERTVSVADYIKENSNGPDLINTMPARATIAIGDSYVFPESYVLGMADVISWSNRNSWIFGTNYPGGKWFYFPTAFAVKSSLALLFLLPVGILFLYFSPEKRREGMFLLIPAVIFFLFAASSSFNTGIRHVLPIYGFLIILASAGAVWLCRRFVAFRYLLIALLVLNAATTFRAAPHYLTYANDLWGGYENTHRIFVDSNTETGQSMKLLSEFLAREGIQDCWIATFVHPEMIRSVQPCRPLTSGVRIMMSRELIEPTPPVIEGTFAISVVELPPRGAEEYVPIARSEPIAIVGGNTYIYRGRFEVPVAAATSRVYRSSYFLRAKRFEEAAAEAREAARLGPEDPRTHLALGVALVQVGHIDEARNELEMALRLAAADPRYVIAGNRARQALEKIGP